MNDSKSYSELKEDKKIETDNNSDKTIDNYLIAKGQFFNIYLIKNTNGEKVAVKRINKNNLFSYQHLLYEIILHQSIHYPGIIEIKNNYEDNENIYISYEYCKNDKEVQCYMLQLIISLNYLHSNNIIHRNLKTSHLLLDENMKLKIGSFRLATKLETKSDKRNEKYEKEEKSLFAPEIFEDKEYSFEIDIWSLGVIMFKLLTGKIPLIKDYHINYNDFKESNLDISSAKMSKAAKDLINQLLTINPLERPTLNQIIYHDFFNREGVPKYFPISTLSKPPDDFPKEVLDKDVIFIDLKSIIKPTINPTITYDNFDLKEIKNNNSVKDIDIYIKRYHDYFSKYGVGYLINNGFVGVYYRDKTKMIYNPKSGDFKYIDNNEIKIFKDYNNIPELNNKIKILKRFENYFDDINKEEIKNN